MSDKKKELKFQNHLVPFELLYRDDLKDESNIINDSLLHLKSKIKGTGLSSFR